LIFAILWPPFGFWVNIENVLPTNKRSRLATALKQR